MPISPQKIKDVEQQAKHIRRSILEMLAAAGSGHPAGALGMADIFAALYFHVLKHDPERPDWDERDRLFLSNGHICPVRYAAMAYSGYFPVAELLSLRQFGSRLQGHPERTMLPGLESTSGPLGSGLGQAAGYALAARGDGKTYRIYCAMSDGEHDEGSTWESVMFAGKNALANLTAIVDRNHIQIDGKTDDVMPLEPLAEKYESFRWRVVAIDGHDVAAFVAAVDLAEATTDRPTVIIAHTIPGKGVKEMENDYRWHGKAPTPDEVGRFLKELT